MIFKIDHRLKEAKANEKPFGGISIVLTGDPGQLLPVLAKPLYDKTSKSPNAVKGFDLYQKFLTVVKLKQVVRQQNPNNCPKQQHFIELLDRLRDGECTLDDWKLLLERTPTPERIIQFENAIRLCDLNEAVDNYNKTKLEQLAQPIAKINGINAPKHCEKATPDNFSGLKNTIFLCINAKIVLTSNIW